MVFLLMLLMPLSPEPAEGAATIFAKHIKAAREAFLLHEGPYWTVGPVLTRVREYMRQTNQTGRVFIRHLSSREGERGVSLRHQVGFIIHGDLELKPPFQEAERPAGRAAFMTLGGRLPRPSRDYSAIRAWIHTRGYEHDGAVTENLEFGDSANTLTGRARTTEILVRILDEPPERSNKPGEGGPTKAHVPQGPPQLDAKDVLAPAGAPPTPPRPGKSALAHKGVPATPHRTLEPIQTHDTDPEEVPSHDSIDILLEARRYDEIAMRIFPENSSVPPKLQVWIGQVVYRINASAKGIERMHPGEGEPMSMAAGAIHRRYRKVSADFALDPLSQAIVRIDTGTLSQTLEAREIVKDLDNLLSGIATREASANSAVAQLGEILQRTEALLRAAESNGENSP